MPYATFSSPVDASFETIWALLVNKVEHPERFVPGVQKSEILERNDDGVLRRMSTAEMTVTERITVDKPGRRVVFTLVDHPVFEGNVVNEVAAGDDDPLFLTFTLDWSARHQEGAGADMMPMIKGAVLHTKELAETGR